MRKLFIVTSSIAPREGRFTYSKTRSFFDKEERLRQTIFTINSIQNAVPDAHIVILDTSDNYQEYESMLPLYFGVEYVAFKKLSPENFEIVNTHLNKSYCECLLINTYLQMNKKQIKEYDFIFKATGRYSNFYLNNDFFTPDKIDKIFFKKPLKFDWNDTWQYNLVDRRAEQGDNFLYQYCTVLYGFASQHLEKFTDIYEAVIHLLNQPSMMHYDIETLLYFFTRPYQDSIIETDWRVCGWDGTSGRMMLY